MKKDATHEETATKGEVISKIALNKKGRRMVGPELLRKREKFQQRKKQPHGKETGGPFVQILDGKYVERKKKGGLLR